MRIRTIKPEFWQSESLSRVSREARLLFIGLFSACDDSGKTRAASRFLASLLFPYDLDALQHIDRWLEELEREGCVRRYKVDGNTYLEIPKWLSHQKIDKPSKSKLPEFAEGSGGFAEDSRGFVVGSGIRDQGKDQVSIAPKATPDGAAKGISKKKPVQRNELLDALATVGGGKAEEVIASKWSGIAKALSEIKAVCPDLTVEEIQRRARNYRTHFTDAILTPFALASHWERCESGKLQMTTAKVFDDFKGTTIR